MLEIRFNPRLWRRLTLLILTCTWGMWSMAQEVATAEYFWDTDPGQGSGTALLAQDGNYDEAIEEAIQNGVPLQSNGLHTFSVRFRDASNNWGSPFTIVISIEANASLSNIPSLAMAEYFWDTDPGQGSGIPLLAQDGNFDEALELALQNNVTLPAQGLHTLNVRVQDSLGTWGPIFRTVLSVETAPTPDIPGLVAAEYFWDIDPGAGNGTTLLAFDGNFDEAIEAVFQNNVSLPATGLHRLGVRVQEQSNVWGPVFSVVVSVEDSITPEIPGVIAGEYFWDNDPGVGNATTILASDGNFDELLEQVSQTNVPLLATGLHTLNFRFQDQGTTWGPIFRMVVSIEDSIASSIRLVQAGELYWDTDPGFGNGIPLVAVDGNFDEALETLADTAVSTVALNLGPHRLVSRMRDASGNWGPDFSVVVWIDTSLVPILSSINGQDLFCENDNLNGVSYSVPFSASNTYNWTVSGGTIASGVGTNAITVNWSGIGTHTISVQACNTDGCGNTIVDTVQVIAAPQAAINASAAINLCAGEDTVLTAVNPGAAGIQWLQNGLALSGASANTFTATQSANYQVVYIAGNNCTDTSSVTAVTISSPLVLNAGADQILCEAGSPVVLGGSPTASGSQGGYAYAWTGANLNNSSLANPTASPTATGTYLLQVTDNIGCSAQDSVTLTVNPTILVNAGMDQNVCQGNTLSLGGSPTATGGVGGFSYSWSPATGLNSTTIPNPVATINTSTDYIVVVTDANNCQSRDTIEAMLSPQVFAEAGGDTLFCDSGTVTLGGAPTGSGGDGFLTYAWSPGSGLSNASSPNPSVSVTGGSQTFTVTVTDINNCTATDQVTVGINPTINLDAGADRILCGPGLTALGGSPTASGGSGGFQYQWSGPSLSSTTVSNPNANLSSNASFSLLVTDQNGCTESDSVNVTVNPAISVFAGNDTTLCDGALVNLGGSPTALGGSGGFNYQWTPNGNLSGATLSNPTANVNSTTTFTVTVSDAVNCQASDQVTITVSPAIQVNAGADQLLCDPMLVTLGASPTASGGAGNLSYAWSGPALSNPNLANPTTTLNTSGTYTVLVTDANGCSAEDSVVLTLNPPIVVDAGSDTTICAGELVPLGGSPTASGGNGSYTYVWSPATALNSPTDPNPIATPGAGIIYNVLVTDGNNCTEANTINIIVEPLPTAAYAFGTNQNTVTFANTSTDATSYFWDYGDGNSGTLPSPTHTYQQPGIYTVCLQAFNSCGVDTFCQDINVNFVGVEDGLDAGAFSVYPNPAVGQVYFEARMAELGKLTLFNQFGQVVRVYEGEWQLGERYRLDLSELPAAVYELRVEGMEGQQWYTKLVVNP